MLLYYVRYRRQVPGAPYQNTSLFCTRGEARIWAETYNQCDPHGIIWDIIEVKRRKGKGN